jgi:hypothetical protein
MKASFCMECGKPLVVLPDPKNPNRPERTLGHYLVGDQMLCIECHEKKSGSEEKKYGVWFCGRF